MTASSPPAPPGTQKAILHSENSCPRKKGSSMTQPEGEGCGVGLVGWAGGAVGEECVLLKRRQ